jgi:hypothetical protein
MSPLIRPGDKVLVSRAAPEQVSFGDIIVFRCDGDLVVHRILKKQWTAEGLRFAEKGDGGYNYGWVSGDKIVGRVVRVNRGGMMLDLSLLPSRFTNLALSVWVCWTGAGVSYLRSSSNTTKVKKALSRLLVLSLRILARGCFIVWCPLGLLARGRDSN